MSYDGNPIIYPFALVKFDLFKPVPEPPHTEDVHYDPGSPKFVRVVQSREEVLAWSNFESVEAIFEQPVNDDFGYYVMDFQGPRSLGTLRPRKIIKAKYEIGPEGAWDYHLIFVDGEGELFRLKITDLT